MATYIVWEGYPSPSAVFGASAHPPKRLKRPVQLSPGPSCLFQRGFACLPASAAFVSRVRRGRRKKSGSNPRNAAMPARGLTVDNANNRLLRDFAMSGSRNFACWTSLTFSTEYPCHIDTDSVRCVCVRFSLAGFLMAQRTDLARARPCRALGTFLPSNGWTTSPAVRKRPLA